MTDGRDIRDVAQIVQELRALGAVDLDREHRTIRFERRPLTPDRRPKTAPAWGHAPEPRD